MGIWTGGCRGLRSLPDIQYGQKSVLVRYGCTFFLSWSPCQGARSTGGARPNHPPGPLLRGRRYPRDVLCLRGNGQRVHDPRRNHERVRVPYKICHRAKPISPSAECTRAERCTPGRGATRTGVASRNTRRFRSTTRCSQPGKSPCCCAQRTRRARRCMKWCSTRRTH